MKYGNKVDMYAELQICDKNLKEMGSEVNELKQKLEESNQQLLLANSALDTVAKEKLILHKQQCIAERKASKYKENNAILKEGCCKLIEENVDISATLLAVQNELNIEVNTVLGLLTLI